MKLLSVGLARVVWVLDVNELNPGGKDIFAHLLPSLVEDYKFKTHPTPSDDLSQGIKLTRGEFIKEDGTVIALNLTIFTDCIVADTFSSTTDSEDFLRTASADLPELGFAFDPEMIRRKAYLSQVTVKCSKPLHALHPKLVEFAGHISSAVGEAEFRLSAIEFWPDQTQTVKAANFSFQQKLGEPPNSDRYWSQAALPTAKHLELLDELEALLA
jgi:hypothetical protein